MTDRASRIEELTVELTRQRSVTETNEEQLITEKVHHFFSQMDYFKDHPEDLFFVPVPNDSWGRKSVMALLRGKKDPVNNNTVVLIGHTDTVGISDYGDLKNYAHLPYELTEKLKERKDSLPDEARADLESGNYLFGRGIFDMKAGDAIIMALMEEYEQKLDDFSGNVLFAAVCDEEANSAGMRSCVPELVRLRDEHNLNLTAVINTDYMTAEYQGDENKYVYVGTVGKLMPSFYVVGKETHVGEAFKGLDPNQIVSELTRRINLNTEFCDTVEGESTLPPMSLKQQDLKTEYSVQTAKAAHAFYNYATHSQTPDRVMDKMKGVAREAFDAVVTDLNTQYEKYCALTGREFEPYPYEVKVLSYDELKAQLVRERGTEVDAKIERAKRKWLYDDAIDERDYALKEVALLQSMRTNQEPVIVVYFTPPYYPHIYVKDETDKEKKLLEAVAQAVDTTDSAYEVVYKKFFPYISDLSYTSAPRNGKAIGALKENMPGFGTKYNIPLDAMQDLSLPVVDIGPFGKDSHQFTERLEKTYSFEVAPELVDKTIAGLLKQ